MKNKNILLLYLLIFSVSYPIEKKTCIIPMADAYPNRYTYHTPFSCNRTDSSSQWLCKGNCIVRYQHMTEEEKTTEILFDNPLEATMNLNNNTYNAGVLGLGFASNTKSVSKIKTGRNSTFIDCTVEIAKINSPYYLHIGFPIQRTEQSINFTETIITDHKVIRGGFMPEYQPDSPSSIALWQNSESQFVSALNNGMKGYLSGERIGNLSSAEYGNLPPCPITLWGLADIYVQFGHDGYKINNTQFGYYGRFIIPTTPTLKSTWNKYLFFPTLGNVDRAEIGLGINGLSCLWDNDKTNGTLHFDGYCGFMFKTEQMRPFDLKNGFFSRYGQVKIFNQNTLNYINKSIRAIDITTEQQNIGGCFKSEIVFDFVYQKWQSFFNIGYSFKSQSKENIDCLDKQYIHQSAQGKLFIFGFSPQQYIQTPNPNELEENSWTTHLVTPHSSMKSIDEKDFSEYQNTGEIIAGIPIDYNNAMTRSMINTSSGLMDTQILNIFFIGYSYQKLRDYYDTIFSIKSGISISPNNYRTPTFAEILISLELDY